MVDLDAIGATQRELSPVAPGVIESSYAAHLATEDNGDRRATNVDLFEPDTLLRIDRLATDGPTATAAGPLGLLRGIELPARAGHAVFIRPSLDLTKIGMLAAGSF